MILKENSIVVLANGHVGAVMSFNGKPTHIMTRTYVRKLSLYNEDGKTNNETYNITDVFDGSNIEDINEVFKTKFDVNSLPKV